MFRIVLVALAAFLSFPCCLPDLHGLATYYGPPAFRDGDIMRNGQPLSLGAATLAVDDSHWPEWANAEVMVLTECGGLHRVRVTDTGRLYRAGRFRWGRDSQERVRYWPVLHLPGGASPVIATPIVNGSVTWLEDGAYSIVADFPRDFFAVSIACEVDAYGRGETTRVWIWKR